MAINFPSGFNITSAEPIDARFVLTKAQMLALKKAQMPANYFCICKEDGFLYTYDATNTVDEETGRFRVANKIDIEEFISDDGDNIITITENGIKVSEPNSIDEDAIRQLFN